jgi:hypothetical protein
MSDSQALSAPTDSQSGKGYQLPDSAQERLQQDAQQNVPGPPDRPTVETPGAEVLPSSNAPQVAGAEINGKVVQDSLDRNKKESDATAASRALTAEAYGLTSGSAKDTAKVDEQKAYERTRSFLATSDLQSKGIIPAVELAYIQDDKAVSTKGAEPENNFTKFAAADGGTEKDASTISSKDLAAIIADKSNKYDGVDRAIAESLIKSRFFTDQNLTTSYSREQLLQMVKDSKKEYNTKVRNISETTTPTETNPKSEITPETRQQAKHYEAEIRELSQGNNTFTRESVDAMNKVIAQKGEDLIAAKDIPADQKKMKLEELGKYNDALKIVGQALTENRDQPLTADQILTEAKPEPQTQTDKPGDVNPEQLKAAAKARQNELSKLYPSGKISGAETEKHIATAKARLEQIDSSTTQNQEQKEQAKSSLKPYLEALSVAKAALQQSNGEPVDLKTLVGGEN